MGAVTEGASILVIEDDRKILRVFLTSLEAEGYRVVDASTGQRAMEEIRNRNPDIILLDLGLPDVDGLDLVPEIRAHSIAPIIVVSAREQDADKVKALDAGANDYLTKPFSVPELLARVRVALRSHAQVGGAPRTTISFGDYCLDLEGRKLMRGDAHVRLSATEFKLLATLARHADYECAAQRGLGFRALRQERIRSRLHALAAAKTRVRPNAPSLPDQRGWSRLPTTHV